MSEEKKDPRPEARLAIAALKNELQEKDEALRKLKTETSKQTTKLKAEMAALMNKVNEHRKVLKKYDRKPG